MRRVLTKVAFSLGALLIIGVASSTAKADLVQLTNVQLQGQGIGAVLTVLTLQAQGASTTESGGVNFNGSVFGNALTGASQSNTFTFATLGITSANQLALVVNLSEPGSENPPSVTATNAGAVTGASGAQAGTVTLNVFSAGGTLLDTFSLAEGTVLNQVGGGVGGSGIVLGLDATQAAQLNALLAATAGTEVFTVGATFANAQGGVDVIQAVRLQPIPEPATMILLGTGLAGVAGAVRRRRSSKP